MDIETQQEEQKVNFDFKNSSGTSYDPQQSLAFII